MSIPGYDAWKLATPPEHEGLEPHEERRPCPDGRKDCAGPDAPCSALTQCLACHLGAESE